METLPTLRQLQYLLALDNHGAFGRAAESCNVTQSTLSGGIRDMEEVLRGAVIDRTHKKGLRFTPLGHEMVRCARAALETVEAAAASARAQNAPLHWPVRLGVIPTIAPYLLPRLLKPLKKALPALDLHIYEQRSEDLVSGVRDGRLDFALMAFPFDTGGLEEKILFTEKFLCAAPKGLFKGRAAIGLSDLKDEKLLLLEDGHCLRDHALEACRLRPLSERKTFSAASLQTLLHMVAEGYGITFLPEMAARDDALPRGVSVLPLTTAAPSRKIGFAFKKSGPRAKDIALVTENCMKILRPR